ncbi:MFS transporter [Mesotoga sp.]|uniref:MFS transporter n=1 Tax=Mesotoga sp. TaxID=2053577 RepID=UPI00262F3327|nr:MFS transporter [Mesotoga sp.]MDD4825733.1 MFS transporter [Mesotoga sp.]
MPFFLLSASSSARETATEIFIYSNLSVMALFSQFFHSKGFSSVEIGILMAVTPTLSVIANPFWFKRSSRKGGPSVMGTLSFVSAIVVWGVFLTPTFESSLIAMSLFAFFAVSVIPISESVVVPSLRSKGKRFNRARAFGTIGYSATALISGILLSRGFVIIFIIASVSLLTAAAVSRTYPSKRILERNESEMDSTPLPIEFYLLVLAGVASITVGAFGSTFLPLLTSEMGYDLSSAGFSFSLMALSEVPFLFFAEKIIDRIGNTRLLLVGIFATGLRWFLTSIAPSFPVFLLFQALHGINYIVVYYSVTNFIHKNFEENKATRALTIYWMSTMGLSYLLGSVLGGVLIRAFGIRRMYTIAGILGMVIAASFSLLFAALRTRGRFINR